MAMVERFPGNGNGFYAEYNKKTNAFVVYYKNSSRFIGPNSIDLRRSLGIAKFTPCGDALRAWGAEMLGDKDQAEPPASKKATPPPPS